MNSKNDLIDDRFSRFDLDHINILPVFDWFNEGVVIVDAQGIVRYYNKAMELIDDISHTEAINKKVTEIYDLNHYTSKIMQCLKTRTPLINHTLLYRTRKGKVANTIHNVYPFFKDGRLNGAICFVKEYNVLEDTISNVSIPPDKKNSSNGTRFTFADIISESLEYLKALNMARRTAKTPSPVMLFGETGTGKELFAQAIHNHAFKGDKKYIPVNCSAIPENLLEGILFGTTKGAFTGASTKPGLFEKASGGTLYLDEVDSMGSSLQAKILRAIQEKRIRRLGSLDEQEINVKIISSINRPPGRSIKANRLREDLFYRLGVVLITIPPLREHMDDLEKLVYHFIRKHSQAMNKRVPGISDRVMKQFAAYHWPGNIRELEHVIESAINMVEDNQEIEQHHLKFCFLNINNQGDFPEKVHEDKEFEFSQGFNAGGSGDTQLDSNITSLKELSHSQEKKMILKAIGENNNNISKTARQLCISRQLLYYKLKKYGIKK